MNLTALVNGKTGIASATILAAVGLGLGGAQTPTMAAGTGMSEIARAAAKGGVDAITAMLDARSPGVRAPGALTQTKPARVASMKEFFKPHERVLSKERHRPGVGEGLGPVLADNLFDPDLGVGALPLGVGGLPDIDGTGVPTTPPAVGGGTFPGGGGPVVIGGGGGNPGGGGTGGTPPGGDGGNPTPPVVNAVPEPGVWLTMLVGFFAIGFGLRRGGAVGASRRVHGRVRFQ